MMKYYYVPPKVGKVRELKSTNAIKIVVTKSLIDYY